MNIAKFRTGLYPGSRRPVHFLVQGEDVRYLAKPSSGLAGWAVASSKSWNKNGKWSGWTGTLTLAPNTELVELVAQLHQTLADTLESFEALAAKHGSSAATWRAALEKAVPKTAAELVRRVAQLEALS